jgi:GNAT superfamily N-acetyltransferase
MNFTIRETNTAGEEIQKSILDSLFTHNEEKVGPSGYRPLAVLIHDANDTVTGGFWGRTAYGWLFTELLFVPELLRGQGLGTELMLRAEKEALARGCHSAWLDTFEFQACAFYERLGYECFGQLDNYPVGYSRYFMKKTLSQERRP